MMNEAIHLLQMCLPLESIPYGIAGDSSLVPHSLHSLKIFIVSSLI